MTSEAERAEEKYQAWCKYNGMDPQATGSMIAYEALWDESESE